MIVDTTFLIDVLRGDSSVDSVLEAIDDSGTPFVSAVTVMELAEGIHLSDAKGDERVAVENILADLNEIPFDRTVAMRAGNLNADLVTAGTPIDETDVMIAATAIEHGQSVLTRNVDHFDRIDELDVQTY